VRAADERNISVLQSSGAVMTTDFKFAPVDLAAPIPQATVRLTFGVWEYRAEIAVTVNSRERGEGLLALALSEARQLIASSGPYPTLALRMANGNTLESSDEASQGSVWLSNMLIGFEIIAFE
jgi:hypothetical protein